MAIAPLWWRQVRPADAPRDEIVAVVSHHTEERVIGLDDPKFVIKDEDADNVGVDEAPDLCFALPKVAIETGVLERYRELRSQQSEQCRSIGREYMWGQHVLEIEYAGQVGLTHKRKTEDRARSLADEILVLGEWARPGGIVKNHAFVRARDIANKRVRNRVAGE